MLALSTKLWELQVDAMVVGCSEWPFATNSWSAAVGRDTTIVAQNTSGLLQRLYLSSNPVAPGDSVMASVHRVVASPPGTYPLSVRQALDSTLTASVSVMIVKR